VTLTAIAGSFTEVGDHALRIFSFPQISKDWRWRRGFGQLAVPILGADGPDHDSGAAMDNIAALPCIIAALVVGGVGLVVTGRTLSHFALHLITRRLLTVNPEGSRNQISQTFYGPGASCIGN
jgi:hypothetical protein